MVFGEELRVSCLNWNTFSSLITPGKKQTRPVVTSSEDGTFYILCACSLTLAHLFFFCFQTTFCLVKSKDIFPCMSDYAELCHLKVIVLSGEWGCGAKSRIRAEN